MSRKKLNIGLFGFGCVGFGLYEVLAKTPGLQASIKNICVKDPNKTRPIASNHFTFDKNDILNDPTINVVVELIDDADAAFEIVKAALEKGKGVVTANKKMIAEHFTELLILQKKYNVPLLYEAACCASMPIIRNLEEYYNNDLLESIEGIVNGSTNYILTKTIEDKLSYPVALKQAQELGYAESNPLLDVGGFDAKYKLQILLAHAFGIITQPKDIFNIGIDRLGDIELKYAAEKNYKIKLVAQAYKCKSGKIAAFVLPKFVDHHNKLYTVDDVFNGVVTKTSFADRQFFVGKGAGAHPTASAVLSDLSALSYDYRYEYKKISPTEALAEASEIYLKVLLRYDANFEDRFKNHFSEIHERYANHNAAFVTGIISLDEIKNIMNQNSENTFSIIAFDTLEDWNYIVEDEVLLPLTESIEH
jgi:homoserine dehydrogenase